VASPADPAVRSPGLYRVGLSSARRELQAGTARRHRADAARATADPRDAPTGSVPEAPPGSASGSATDLATQRAGVRAALAELRQHRRTA
jgi:hypothetical protein